MLNLLDQLLGLTAKVLGHLLDWPFLLFIFLVWLANRYRDQIGSALDRRGAIKRSELASAIRDELDPLNRDLGDLKPDVSQLRTRVAKIEALQSEYALEQLLKPIKAKLTALEESVQTARTRVDQIGSIDLGSEISGRLSPINSDMERLRENLDRLAKDFQPVDQDLQRLKKSLDQVAQEFLPLAEEVGTVKQSLAEITERLEPVNAVMESFQTSLKHLESRVEETPSADAVQRLHQEMEQMGEELAGVTVSVDLLKSKVENYSQVEEPLAQSVWREQSATALKEVELIPLRVMKDALSSTRWEWRRVKKLAGIAGLTEEKALEILESDPDLVVKKDDWGRHIAKLSTR